MITHRQLIADTGRIDRNALMLFAWQRVRSERALWRRCGRPPPPLRQLIAHELSEAWGWARACRRGRQWGTLYNPRQAAGQFRRAA